MCDPRLKKSSFEPIRRQVLLIPCFLLGQYFGQFEIPEVRVELSIDCFL